MRPLKQRGVERTGTTMTAKMVQKAFGVRGLVGQKLKPNKHSLVRAKEWPPNTALMINIKDPYAWIVSWHAWTQQAKFNGRKIPLHKQPVAFEVASIVSVLTTHYNALYKNWMQLPYDKVVLKYEDVLADPKIVYRKMATLLKAAPDPNNMWETTPPKIVRPGRTPMKGLPRHDFNRAYYEKKEYLDLLTADQIAAITDTVDWPLFADLYEPIRQKLLK